jgi:hypothetical protein
VAVVDVIKKPVEQYRGDPRQGVFLVILTGILFFGACSLLIIVGAVVGGKKELLAFLWFTLAAMLGLVLVLTWLFMFVPPPDVSLAKGQRARAKRIAAVAMV